MTLEIGIDIGDVDLVICVDPPFSLSSFLQRIGRGCRRLQGKTRVLCVARDRAGELIFRGLIRQARLGIPAGPIAPFRRSVLVQQTLAYLRQVHGNRRTLGQFTRVLSHPSAPAVTSETIAATVSDMVATGLLAERNGIFQPASEGWEFIESSAIYSNIAAEPAGVTLVDAESGEPIAKVAGFNDRKDGVRVAGRSYDFMADSGNTLRVREGGQHMGAPRYFERKLPYASHVGISTGASLGLAPSQLAVIECGGELIVMTWQGRLVNSCLAATLSSHGTPARATAFSLLLSRSTSSLLIALIREAASRLVAQNPLGELGVESIVEVGPNFHRLSIDAQADARRDWLDLPYIDRWAAALQDVVAIAPDSALGADLSALACL
jgi:ATP-dependent helicase Lhr and Lhr-like helicase